MDPGRTANSAMGDDKVLSAMGDDNVVDAAGGGFRGFLIAAMRSIFVKYVDRVFNHCMVHHRHDPAMLC